MTRIDSRASRPHWDAPLPIDAVLPELRAALTDGRSAVLQAPPGAGKTTHVPLALLGEPWLGGSRILMLEPRRLAARAVTHRMAQLIGERAGDTVGYRVRRDTRIGPRTRIEVVTEGILTRMLQKDPTLDGVGLLIFDEFHERSIHADTGLALALHSRSLVRPDLRILVMSATMDGARVARLLRDAPIITSEGRTYPVEVVYTSRPDSRSLPSAIASHVMHALDADDGGILVFLPGGGEIRRVASLLEGRVHPHVSVERLYGDLSQDAQDAAIAAPGGGHRKIVLATPIAETSLTIEGVGVVIDSGLARVPRFSPRSGMTRLETARISRASADQRAGRAGRTGPGRCYRLWPEVEQHHLAGHSSPEILQADLSPLVLELAVAGIRDVTEVDWLDVPPAAALQQGADLLVMLGAIDSRWALTPHGRAMAALPVHPRIAHMLIKSQEMGAAALGCDIAAILEERDFLRGVGGPASADIETRLELLRSPRPHSIVDGAEVDIDRLRRIRSEAAALRRQLGVAGDSENSDVSTGVVLALAYPDRIAQARGNAGDGRFLLRNGSGAILTRPQELSGSEYIVAADLDGDARSARIFLGASLTRAELEIHCADQIEIESAVEWDERTRSVRAREVERLGAIILSESILARPPDDAVIPTLLGVVRREGLASLPWTESALGYRERLAFLRLHHADWPDVTDAGLLDTLEEWLAPLLAGRLSLRDIGPELDHVLPAMLDWEQRGAMERLAPSHYLTPAGTRISIDYSDSGGPSIAVRLQEMFGVRETPTVDSGRVALTVKLLSPARRPVQVTRDLAGFWSGSYFEVRKELRGRYPKHSWPDDPASATPTTRARRRGE